MQIQFNNDYRLSSDPMNVILEKRNITKPTDGTEPKEYWVNLSYHPNIESACMKLLRFVTNASEATTLNMLIQEQHEIKRDIVAAIEKWGVKG